MKTFKPYHRLEYIDELNKLEISGESHIRCIVHQAYYAGLNQLQFEIDNRLFFPMDAQDRYEKSHQAVIDACSAQIRKLKSGDPKRELVNRIYNNMKRNKLLRTDADYNLKSIEPTHANRSLNYAREIFNDLEAYQ